MIVIPPTFVLIGQILMTIGVRLLDKLWPVSTRTLALGLHRLIRLRTRNQRLLHALRVFIAVTAGAGDLANHHLGIWGGVVVLLREEFLEHVNRVLVDLLLHAAGPAATAPTLRHSNPVLVFS
jgi:hypothetical protein